MATTHITLVHGTNAADGKWFLQHSFFRMLLTEQVKRPIAFHILRWDGQNSHASRISAAQALTTHVRHVRLDFPGASQYVVCHSHGGNIALYAAKDKAFRRAVSGIVTMGTPFLNCTPNAFVTSLLSKTGYLTTLALAAFCIAMLVLLIPWWIVLPTVVRTTFGSWADFVWNVPFLAGLACLFAVAVVRGTEIALALQHQVREQQINAVARLSVGRWPGAKLFIARVGVDEAGWWLRALTELASMPHRLNRLLDLLTWLSYSLRSRLGFVLVAILAVVVDPIGFRSRDSASSDFGPAVLFALFLAYLVRVLAEFAGVATTAVAIGATLLAPPIIALFRSHALGFGVERMLQSASVDIRAYRAPIALDGQATIYETTSLRLLGLFGGLRHSVFYEDAQVVHAIGQWIAMKEENTLLRWNFRVAPLQSDA